MKTKHLPEGFVKCESTDVLYRLKPRKKKRVPENLELDIGKHFYIYSHYSKDYRRYILEDRDPWLHKVEQFILMGIVYHRP